VSRARAVDPIWLKAAVLGSVWAACEIVLGSFLHNLRVPLRGRLLTFLAIAILVAGHRRWRLRGLVWRAGLVCALMKTASPSAVILGPMIAIFMEALALDCGILLLGAGPAGYLLGGGLAMSWILVQQAANAYLFYGRGVVDLYLGVFARLRSGPLLQAGPWAPPAALLAVHFLLGALAAAAGGRLSPRAPGASRAVRVEAPAAPAKGGHSPAALLAHALLLPAGLYWMDKVSLGLALAGVALYSAACASTGRAVLRLKKPGFWAGLALMCVLSGLFLGGGDAWKGASAGARMCLRAAFLVVGLAAVGEQLRNPRVKAFFRKLGGENLSEAADLAFETVPSVIAALPPGGEMLKRPLLSVARVLGGMDLWLADVERRAAGRAAVHLVTGGRGAGKTALLMETASLLRASGIRVAGVCAPGIWRDGRREGFDALDLSSGDRRALCRRGEAAGGVSAGPFHFLEEGLALGHAALSPERLSGAGVVFVDEVGILEMGGKGWAPDLDALSCDRSRPMVWAVREGLVSEVRRRWGLQDASVWDAGSAEAADLAARISERG
jgi:nucleoside-triphosphatase THEP1